MSEIQGALSKISLYTILAPPLSSNTLINLHFCYARVKDTTGTSPIKQKDPPPSPCVHVGLCRCCGHGSLSSSLYSTSSPSLSCSTQSSACGCLPLPHPSPTVPVSHSCGSLLLLSCLGLHLGLRGQRYVCCICVVCRECAWLQYTISALFSLLSFLHPGVSDVLT